MSIADLFAELASMPSLPGARCRGHVELFDHTTGKSQAADTRKARTAALGICHDCPARHACRAWLDTLPAGHRPIGKLPIAWLVVVGAVEQRPPISGRRSDEVPRAWQHGD
jgi:hypothetical protein